MRPVNEKRPLNSCRELFREILFAEINIQGDKATFAYVRFGTLSAQQLAANERAYVFNAPLFGFRHRHKFAVRFIGNPRVRHHSYELAPRQHLVLPRR
nr:MAG: hypothetical protein [Bacteriophage sp.]